MFAPLILATVLSVAWSGPAHAQPLAKPAGKIYCWKNKAGTTECGDKIPYEYQPGAVKELNRQGVVTDRREPVNAAENKAREAALANKSAGEQKEALQRRQDRALLDAFSNEREIELKRARDVGLIESTMDALRSNLKNMDDRYAYTRGRADSLVKAKRPVPAALQEELDRIGSEREKAQRSLAQRQEEVVALNKKYADMKKRYAELTAANR